MTDCVQALITYHQLLLPALFATGFTVGSFLFSMKSTIIKTVREDVFDNEKYQLEVCQKIALGKNEGFYTKLQNFSSLLMKAITWSFLSAIFQVVLGAFKTGIASGLCFMVAIVSWVYLARAIYHVQNNMRIAIEYKETLKNEEMEAKITELKKGLEED
jgi:hypothetical protein